MLKMAIKKTAIKKVLSCFLVFVILMSVVPVSVLASDSRDGVRGDVLNSLSGGSDLSDCVFGSPKEAVVGENTKLNFAVSLTGEPCKSRVDFGDKIQWFIYKPDETEIEGEKDVLTSSCAGAPCDDAYYDFPDVGVYTIEAVPQLPNIQ